MRKLEHLTDVQLLEYHRQFAMAAQSSKRFQMRKVHGYDTKFGYHVVRLLIEAEQIMVDGDIDLQRNNEQLKAIRRGEWDEAKLRDWASAKERDLEEVYNKSQLRYSPDEPAIRQLLLNCLEEHYGNLDECVVNPNSAVLALKNIQAELEKVRGLL